MTRRRLLCGLLLASAVLACFGGWLWITSRQRVTRARFEQVKSGMSREEVILMVGSPPDHYWRDGSPIHPAATQQSAWFCGDAELVVDFDDAGSALNVMMVREPTLTERIRRWLGL
jgi:hypothetical protein